MRRKIITIVVCGLLLMSGIAMIPKNIDVKAEAGGGSGNEVGINVTYIQTIAQTLSNIVKFYPKGRTYGTDGEREASRVILGWMNETGLYDVHKEDITYGFNETGSTIAIDKKVEDLSEGLTINNTHINKSEFYIEPPQNGASDSRALLDYFLLHDNYTEDPVYWDHLTHNFSYYNVSLQQRPHSFALSWVLAHVFSSDCKGKIDNGTIYNFDTFAWYMLEKTAEYFNFSWDDLINDPLNTTITNNSQYNDFFNYSTEPTGSNFVYIEEEPSFNPDPAPDLVYIYEPRMQ
jgi:hypothetical protein